MTPDVMRMNYLEVPYDVRGHVGTLSPYSEVFFLREYRRPSGAGACWAKSLDKV